MKFTKEQLQEIKKLYENEQMSTTQISKIFGTSRSIIGYNLKKMNAKIRPRGKKFTIDSIKEKLNTPEFEYFIGILATDGSICNNIIALEFSEENKEILEHWNHFLGGSMNINIHTNSRRIDYYKITFQDKEFSKLLEQYGITSRKSYTLELSYINWNILLGIFDGGGSLSIDTRHGISGKFRIASGSEKFLKQIQNYLLSYSIKSTIYKDSHSKCMSLTVGMLEDIITIYNNIYKNSSYFLKRKYDKFGPLLEKFNSKHSVNSVNEMEYSKTEPSLIQEGVETRNGEPKSE